MAAMTCGNCSRKWDKKLHICGQCRNVSYCDVICQKQAWKSHKQDCQPGYVFKELTGKGVGVLATRSISSGDLIFREKPLFTLHDNLLTLFNDEVDVEVAQRTVEKKLAALETHLRVKFWQLYDDHRLQPKTSPYGLFRTNAHRITSGGLNAVFLKMCRLNHSCAPNAYYCWLPDKQMVHVRAIRDIEPEQEITLSYLTITDHLSRSERRRELREKFGFDCVCPDCSLHDAELQANDCVRMHFASETARMATDGPQEALERAEQCYAFVNHTGAPFTHVERAYLCGEAFKAAIRLHDYEKAAEWATKRHQHMTICMGHEHHEVQDAWAASRNPELFDLDDNDLD